MHFCTKVPGVYHWAKCSYNLEAQSLRTHKRYPTRKKKELITKQPLDWGINAAAAAMHLQMAEDCRGQKLNLREPKAFQYTPWKGGQLILLDHSSIQAGITWKQWLYTTPPNCKGTWASKLMPGRWTMAVCCLPYTWVRPLRQDDPQRQ